MLERLKLLEKRIACLYNKMLGISIIQGPAGPTGPQGIAGNNGIAGPVGPAGLTWKSTWSSGTAYLKDDAVGYNGASYFRLISGTTTGLPNVDTTNWALLASQGANGIQGVQGPTGAQGTAGTLPVKTKGQLYGSTTTYETQTLLSYDINVLFNGSENSFFKLPDTTIIGKEVIVDVYGPNPCDIFGFNLGIAFQTSITSQSSQIATKNNDLIKFTSTGPNFWIVEYLIRTPIVIPTPVTKVLKTTITTAQVLQLFTTPITVLAAATTGKVTIPINIYINRNAGTAYTLNTMSFSLLDFFLNDTGTNINPNPLQSSSIGHINNTIYLGESVNGSFTNAPYKLKAVGGNPTGGTGNLDVYVTYMEITL